MLRRSTSTAFLGAELAEVHLVLGERRVVGVLLRGDLGPELGHHVAALADQAVQLGDLRLVGLLALGDRGARRIHHAADLAHHRLAEDLALHRHDLVGEEALQVLDAALLQQAGVVADLGEQRLLRRDGEDALARDVQVLRGGLHHAHHRLVDLGRGLELVPHEVDFVQHRDLCGRPGRT
jgi:hypothetical protein